MVLIKMLSPMLSTIVLVASPKAMGVAGKTSEVSDPSGGGGSSHLATLGDCEVEGARAVKTGVAEQKAAKAREANVARVKERIIVRKSDRCSRCSRN